MRRLTIAVN